MSPRCRRQTEQPPGTRLDDLDFETIEEIQAAAALRTQPKVLLVINMMMYTSDMYIALLLAGR